MKKIITFFFILLIVTACVSEHHRAILQMELQALQLKSASVPGFAIFVISDGQENAAATGVASSEGEPMSATTPVRIASVTKTFVASAILRLWEDERLDLDESISNLIPTDINEVLLHGGYRTDLITVRHLLMHSSGLADHATEAYVRAIFSNPNKVWTSKDQIEFLVASTDPIGSPGAEYKYSDTGYILLGEILRQETGLPLHIAVHQLLKLDEIGLDSVYWDEAEDPKSHIPDRAHQWLLGQDIFAFHGSMDAHGGGGLIGSAKDMAHFYDALFEGLIFEEGSTLEVMIKAPGHPVDSPYRFGIFAENIGGYQSFGHSGYWGTEVIHVPALKLTIAGVTLDQEGLSDLRQLMIQTLLTEAKQ